MEFNFREVSTKSYFETNLQVFRETTTDCLFVRYREGGLTQMLNPQTGKPLTYTNWIEKYKEKSRYY